jgi:hypothetical protein
MNYSVSIGYDTAGIYYVFRSNIIGLDAKAKAFDALVAIVKEVAPALLRDRGAKVVIEPGIVVCNCVKAKELVG